VDFNISFFFNITGKFRYSDTSAAKKYFSNVGEAEGVSRFDNWGARSALQNSKIIRIKALFALI